MQLQKWPARICFQMQHITTGTELRLKVADRAELKEGKGRSSSQGQEQRKGSGIEPSGRKHAVVRTATKSTVMSSL